MDRRVPAGRHSEAPLWGQIRLREQAPGWKNALAAALANGLEPDGDVDAIAASQLLDEIAWFESSGIDPLDASSGDLEADARRGGE